MRAFYLAYPLEISGSEIVPQAVGPFAEPLPDRVADLPWGHQATLLEKLKTSELRGWYAKAAVTHGWSRAVLIAQIETRLHEREGSAVTNFTHTLPPPQSDLARQSLKAPYVFGFLTLAPDAEKREFELGLIAHIQQFLLELGVGFAFVGRQVHLKVGARDFNVDLLFWWLERATCISAPTRPGREPIH